ncbi:chromatin DNA-binding EKC/KEOPS complex subunit PCC1 KNAG_0C06620 [Huiozyma naganishii CBS 8797]|uniref:Transcription factor Pcc1 n=1 Tax=Huiozyma naganishii (strain ATCC MYA-139 / BCRC 22969 / CBS 8797 / KCTC 17520 / NBRC 10181 / NCYC 3082 / Yp74L-3) TaxID=1071383 RepID=J7S5A6_HUIN7|nr:hypothetical protein KNAG_0C06620 [Kazachstania naganishii CBS 8797]CCK69754.1 hypothetical protein KNAG_0C06620 [Kazachstania naganishii CBS 8797]
MTTKTARPAALDHTLTLNVPFETPRQALIASQVLQPDPILKPQDFAVSYAAQGPCLEARFCGRDARVLRVGVSSVIDSLKTIIESLDELDQTGPSSTEASM